MRFSSYSLILSYALANLLDQILHCNAFETEPDLAGPTRRGNGSTQVGEAGEVLILCAELFIAGMLCVLRIE